MSTQQKDAGIPIQIVSHMIEYSGVMDGQIQITRTRLRVASPLNPIKYYPGRLQTRAIGFADHPPDRHFRLGRHTHLCATQPSIVAATDSHESSPFGAPTLPGDDGSAVPWIWSTATGRSGAGRFAPFGVQHGSCHCGNGGNLLRELARQAVDKYRTIGKTRRIHPPAIAVERLPE